MGSTFLNALKREKGVWFYVLGAVSGALVFNPLFLGTLELPPPDRFVVSMFATLVLVALIKGGARVQRQRKMKHLQQRSESA